MADKLIIDHYKKMKLIEDRLEAHIDAAIDSIDIELLVENPKETLRMIVDDLIEHIADNVIAESADLGVKFGDKLKEFIKKDKEIKVETGTDKAIEKAFSNVEI